MTQSLFVYGTLRLGQPNSRDGAYWWRVEERCGVG